MYMPIQFDRRSFFKLSAATAASLALGATPLWAQEECVTTSVNIIDYLIANTSIPATLSGQIFLGYRPIPFHAAAKRLPDDFLFSSYGLYVGARADGFTSGLELVKKQICGTTFWDHEIVASSLSGAYAAKRDEIVAKREASLQKRSASPYDRNVEEIIKILVLSFRDVLYQNRPEDKILSKTYPVLRTDNTGLCRDFALTRYTLAKGLGVKDEHLCMISYLNRKEKGAAHANVAVYNPARKVWTIVDGTGRLPEQSLGPTVAYENERQSWAAVKNQCQDQIPVIGIHAGGVFLFDSIDYKNASRLAAIKPRLPLHKIGTKANIIGTTPE